MTVTLSVWLLPIAATVLVWALAALWPSEVYHDGFGFGAALDALARVGGALFATLLIWLAFFVLMWWGA